MNLFKKIALAISVPAIMGSCTILDETYSRNNGGDGIYQSRQGRNLSNLSNSNFMMMWNKSFRNSVYSRHLGYDNDGDGIVNHDDIWPNSYGPYVDMNNNGVVDIFDMQVAGFGDSYIDSYPYTLNSRWAGLNLSPYWYGEYNFRYENYFNGRGMHRHHDNSKGREYYHNRNSKPNIYYQKPNSKPSINKIKSKASGIKTRVEKRVYKNKTKTNYNYNRNKSRTPKYNTNQNSNSRKSSKGIMTKRKR